MAPLLGDVGNIIQAKSIHLYTQIDQKSFGGSEVRFKIEHMFLLLYRVGAQDRVQNRDFFLKILQNLQKATNNKQRDENDESY